MQSMEGIRDIGMPTVRRSLHRRSGPSQVTKRTQVVLTKKVSNLGGEGTLVAVRNGYFRNYLLPLGMAKVADEAILA